MNSYQEPQDFLMDASFRKWISDPDPATSQYWETWMKEHPEKEEVVNEAKRLLSVIGFRNRFLSAEDSQSMLEAILSAGETSDPALPAAETAASAPVSGETHGPDKRPRATAGIRRIFKLNARAGYKIAAAFALLAACLIYFLVADNGKARHYATGFAEIKTVVLPDSSKIILNANSELSFSPHWDSSKPREVWLQGEGLFMVTKKTTRDTKVKFIVHTENLDVEVLGTVFNVKERPSETRVVLRSGKVRLDRAESPAEPVYMQPGESVKLLRQENRLVKEKVDTRLYTSWTEQKLILENTKASELAVTLKEIYGYEIVFEDRSAADKLLNGTLPTDRPESLLRALSILLDVSIQKQGKTIVIKNN